MQEVYKFMTYVIIILVILACKALLGNDLLQGKIFNMFVVFVWMAVTYAIFGGGNKGDGDMN